MLGTARIIVAVPVLVALAWATFWTVRLGSTGSTAFWAGREMAAWRTRPSQEAFIRMNADLDQAISRDPKDPSLQETLGRLFLAGGRDDAAADEAITRFANAVRLRPTSAYSWANLAEALYRKGNTGPRFQEALQRATETGPWEPAVQAAVADFGLAVWDEVSSSTRSSIERMVANGMVRNAPEMLQISARRGRLGVACAHLGLSTRADPKWTRICP